MKKTRIAIKVSEIFCIFLLSLTLSACASEKHYYNETNIYNHNISGENCTVSRDIYDSLTVSGWNGYICTDEYEIIENEDEIYVTIVLRNMSED